MGENRQYMKDLKDYYAPDWIILDLIKSVQTLRKQNIVLSIGLVAVAILGILL